MSNALTYWMSEDSEGNLEFNSTAPEDGKTYIAVTPEFLRRMPIALCEAPSGGTANQNIYYVHGDLSDIYSANSNTGLTVMMFIASHNSIDTDSEESQAKICFMPSKTYINMKTISDTGFERPIYKGDIIANKVCFIRYNPITQNIILINPSMDKEASVSKLLVFKEALFNITPKIRNEIIHPDGTIEYQYTAIPRYEDFQKLEDRVRKLENKFIIGIGDPKDALDDAEEGSIFLKLGDVLK